MGCCASRQKRDDEIVLLQRKIKSLEMENFKLENKCNDITIRYGLLLSGNCDERISDALRKLYNTV